MGTIILVGLSSYIVALLKRDQWPESLVTFLSILVVAVFFVLGQLVDGVLIWPLSSQFWDGLLASWGGQQLFYKLVIKDTPSLSQLDKIGNKPALTQITINGGRHDT